MVTKPTPVPQPDMILESGLIIGVQVVNPTGDFLLEKIEWVVLEKGMTYDQVHPILTPTICHMLKAKTHNTSEHHSTHPPTPAGQSKAQQPIRRGLRHLHEHHTA